MVKYPSANVGDVSLILGREVPLEKEMATHSSILAQETPWSEDPGGLQSSSVQSLSRVRLFATP